MHIPQSPYNDKSTALGQIHQSNLDNLRRATEENDRLRRSLELGLKASLPFLTRLRNWINRG